MRLTLEGIAEIDAAAKAIGEVSEEIRDFRKPFRRAAKDVVIPEMKAAFRGGRSPSREKWEPVDTLWSLLKRRMSRSASKKLLVLSGSFQKSMTRIGNVVGAVRLFGRRFAVFGSDLFYASTLQWGRSINRKKAGDITKRKVEKPTRKVDGSKRTTTRRKAEIGAQKSLGVPPRNVAMWSQKMAKKFSIIMIEHAEALFAKQEKILAAKRRRGV